MKVILSRKGFDSGYGGWASPILPDGRMLSLPIPASNGLVSYDDLSAGNGQTYVETMRELRQGHESRLSSCLSPSRGGFASVSAAICH